MLFEVLGQILYSDWYLAVILLFLFTITFGHSLEKSLEKKHLASHSLGLLISLPIVLFLIIFFYVLAFLSNMDVRFYYNLTYIIFILISIKRLFQYAHSTRKK